MALALSKKTILDWLTAQSSSINHVFSSYEKVWFISINNYDEKSPMSPDDNVLIVNFNDYDLNHIGGHDKIPWDDLKSYWDDFELKDGPLFSAGEARRMVTFIKKVNADTRRGLLVVHCHAGVSRSGAVVKFLQEAYKLDREGFEGLNPNISPNRLVLHLLHEAFDLLKD